MTVRSVEQWTRLLDPIADDPLHEIAMVILRDMTNYRIIDYADDDYDSMANALVAWTAIQERRRGK